MSEQETSRNEGSSSTSESKDREVNQGTPQDQCCSIPNTCNTSSTSDSGMGNIIFTPLEADDHDKESKDCDSGKQDSEGEEAKVSSSEKRGSALYAKETVHSDHKQSKFSEDNITPTEGLKEDITVFKKRENEDLQEKPLDTERSEADHCPSSSVDEGIELHDSSDALENSGEEDNENISDTVKHCDRVCVSDVNSTSAVGKKEDIESTPTSSEACGTLLKSENVPETQELEVPERGEGVDVLLKCIDKEQQSSDLSKGGTSDLPQPDYLSIVKNSSLGTNNLCTEGTLGADISNLGVGSCNIMVNNNIGTESCSRSLESCNVGVQGCSVSAESCYSSGDNLVCAREPIRDTDSEAGDSVCSEDHEHEACRGENGCVHRVAGDALDHNWEFAVDEEFNVPRKPIFNGSADQLDRRSSLKRKASEEPEESKPAKCKRGIQFEGVTVFYFPRSQGFTCVPSQGGSSLGMSRRHSHIRQFSLAEHAVEQRRAHREYLMRLRQQRSARVGTHTSLIIIEHGESSSRGSSSEDSEENSEEASDLSDSELDADSYYFLQPLPIRQRRTLLRQAGICHIEGLEKEECKDIRISREMCGCQCKVYCDPDTCQCAQAGIKCQVDRHNFPCGCSREGCGNSYGRIEFNPIRVRTHFIHTLMRLEIEKRQTQQQQHHRQEQEWEQQHQQQRAKWAEHRAKWAKIVAATNGFTGESGGLGGGNLPFFEGSQDSGGLSVVDVNKFNSSVEMGACVGSMNAPVYQHFESRQMLGPGGSSVYIQHDSVGDYNSGTCSVFGGLGATFDPSGAYGSCHSFPSGSVVPPSSQVAPQVTPSQPVPPDAYNSLSKFTNSTTNLVSASFPYSGDVSPAATASVNCSYPQNNFCMTAVHDNTNGTVFGQYHEASTVTQNLFKASVNECGDFQPNFEALSSSPASTEKASRYIPAPSIIDQVKEIHTAVSSQCPGIVNESYKVMGAGSSSSSWSSSSHHTTNDATEVRHPQLPISLPPPPPLRYDHAIPGKDTPGNEEPTDAAENLGEIVKKSMVETVSA